MIGASVWFYYWLWRTGLLIVVRARETKPLKYIDFKFWWKEMIGACALWKDLLSSAAFSDDITPVLAWNIIGTFPIWDWTKTSFSIGRSSIMCSPGVRTLTWIKTQMTPAHNWSNVNKGPSWYWRSSHLDSCWATGEFSLKFNQKRLLRNNLTRLPTQLLDVSFKIWIFQIWSIPNITGGGLAAILQVRPCPSAFRTGTQSHKGIRKYE